MKIKSLFGYSGLFLSVFSLSACIAFFSVPSSVQDPNYNSNNTSKPTIEIPTVENPSRGDLLIAQLASDPRISGDIDLTIEFPDDDGDDSTNNIVNMSGSLGFGMKTLEDISLGLDATIDYNGVKKDLGATLVEGSLYLSLTEWNNPANPKEFRDLSGVKYKVTSADFETLIGMVVDVVGADSDIWNVNSYIGAMDTSSMSLDSLDFSIECTNETDYGYEYVLKLNTGSMAINAVLGSDLDYNLTKVYIPEIKVGDVKVSVDINSHLSTSVNEEIKPLGNPSDYLHFVNSVDIIKKLYHLVEDKRFGVDVNASLKHKYSSDPSEYETLDISASLNADLDFNSFALDASISNDVVIDDEKKTYAKTITAGYQNNDIYLNYNNVLKASLNTTTLGELLGRIQEDMTDSDASDLGDLTSFITDSEFMNEIEHGRYQGVLELIDDVRCADNQISITVSLDQFGLGNESKVIVNLDANDTATSLASIEVKDANFSQFTLDATISLANYEENDVDMAEFPALTKLNGIYDQFYNIAQSKKAGLEFEGSILGIDGEWQGFEFSGVTQFDVDGEIGTGELSIQELYPQFGVVDHELILDVSGRSDMKFAYNEGLKGKFTIKTLQDMIDLVMNIVNDDDPRFSKYFSGLDNMATDSLIGQVMDGQYFSLLQADILESFSINDDDSINVVINPASLGVDMPISLTIKRTATGELDYLSINLVFSGVDINLTARLVDYDDNQVQRLNPNDSFMDFSELKTLLEYVYNTAKLNSFAILGTVEVGIGALDLLKVELAANILIEDGNVSAYGSIKVPTIPAVNHTNILSIGGNRTTTFYYTDGYVYLYRKTDITGSWWDTTDYVKYEQGYFVSNIGDVLLDYVLGLNDNVKESIGDLGSSDPDAPIQFDKMITKFNFTPSSRILNIGLDLGVLTRNKTLKVIDINFVGSEDQYLSSLDFSTTITIIKLKGDITNNNIGGDNWTPVKSKYDSYISSHSGDTLNTIIKG
ncbi:MAG: hypothetical protein MJ238_01955 [Bacilli bacterium]|nr:hypothetical protein [Bacilli bacterium]